MPVVPVVRVGRPADRHRGRAGRRPAARAGPAPRPHWSTSGSGRRCRSPPAPTWSRPPARSAHALTAMLEARAAAAGAPARRRASTRRGTPPTSAATRPTAARRSRYDDVPRVRGAAHVGAAARPMDARLRAWGPCRSDSASAAYAVILRDDRILLSRLAPCVTSERAVDAARRRPRLRRGPARRGGARGARGDRARRRGRRDRPGLLRAPAQRLARRPAGRRARRCGSCTTGGCRSTRRSRTSSRSTAPPSTRPGCRSRDVLDGTVPVAPLVLEALARPPARSSMQRLAAYALVRRGDAGAADPDLRARLHPGRGRCPAAASTTASRRAAALVREVREECGRRRARSATCSACTTSTSAAPRRRGATRTSTRVHLVFAADGARRRRAAGRRGRRHHRRASPGSPVARRRPVRPRSRVTDVGRGFALGPG